MSENLQVTPYQAPMHNFGSSIILMTNPEDVLQDMELYLRGMTLDKNDNPVKVDTPKMNERGITDVLGSMRGIVNKITIMGNLDNQEVQAWTEYSAEILTKVLMLNRINYAMSYNNRRLIFFKAMSTIYMVLKRPYMEGDRRFWGKAHQEIKQVLDTGDSRPLWQRALGIKAR